jgi:serine/threonine-protein kinase
VDGCSLAELLRSSNLDVRAVSFIGAELAAALAYLHGRRGPDGAPLGLVHCDLNPPNVLCSTLGEVKLADFGVARAAAGRSTSFGGKARYAPPEQRSGGPIDGRADLYALGITLHEALTGVPVRDVKELAPLSSIRPDVPAALDALVLELCAPRREARPESAAVVRARLRALGAEVAPYPHGQEILAAAVARKN